MQYRAVMGVSSLPVVGAKMAFSVGAQWQMIETGMKMMYIVVLLYVLLAMYARKVPFLPQPPVTAQPYTAGACKTRQVPSGCLLICTGNCKKWYQWHSKMRFCTRPPALFHLMLIVDVHWMSTHGYHQVSRLNRCLIAVLNYVTLKPWMFVCTFREPDRTVKL